MQEAPPAVVDTLLTAIVPRYAIRFVRFWCHNMDAVHAARMEWPGFGYTEPEKAEMKRIAGHIGAREAMLTYVLVVILMLIASAFSVISAFNLLSAVYPRAQDTPATVFFLYLAAACILALTVGLVGSLLLAVWLVGLLYAPAPESLPDAAFVGMMFPKVVWQITRMSLLMVAVSLLYWIFVPTGSKLDLFIRGLVPLLSPVVTSMTLLMYAAGRVRRASERQQ